MSTTSLPLLQLYESCTASGSHFSMVSMADVYELIRGDALKAATDEYRRLLSLGRSAECSAMKRGRFPALMPACVCAPEGRRTDFVTACTHVCQADFDRLPADRVPDLMRRLRSVPEVLLAFVSMSGRGIHVYYRWECHDPVDSLDAELRLYAAAFARGNGMLADLLSADYDRGTAPVVHLSSLCHDPDAWFNPDARPMVVSLSSSDSGVSAVRHPVVRREAERMNADVRDASSEGPAATDSESLCRLAREWRDRSDSFSEGNRHNYLVRLLFLMSDLGIPAADAEMYLTMNFGEYREEPFHRLVANCYRYAAPSFGVRRMPVVETRRGNGSKGDGKREGRSSARDGRQKSPGVRMTKAELACEFIRRQELRFDVISRKIIRGSGVEARELTDRDVNSMLLECVSECGVNISVQVFRAMLMSEAVPAFNPLADYIDSLPQWNPGMEDHIARVAAMVHVAGGRQELFTSAFRKWMVAMVAGWTRTDVVNHQVLVLIGPQGIYKTTWLDSLMPPSLTRYLSKQSGGGYADKDEMLRSTEFGLINLDEIDRLSERELNALKSLITATDVNVRAAYGYVKERRMRIASYVASGNKDRFLTDTTGNRRWLPFRVEHIDPPQCSSIPHEGMYAQAAYLLRSGFRYWFDAGDMREMEAHSADFMVETSEEQLIPMHFDPADTDTPGAMFMTLAEISAKLTAWGNIRKPMDLRRLGVVMNRLGYTAVRKGHGGLRGYILREKSQMDVDRMHNPKNE